MNIALTIAGSDSGGGAGIQADLKTFHSFGVFGTSAVTAITAQNTLGVREWQAVRPGLVRSQIDAVASDLRPNAIKSGMLANAAIVRTVASAIADHGLGPYVLDPVMIATSGDPLLEREAIDAVVRDLIPLASVVTPNSDEATVLTGMKVRNDEDMQRVAVAIASMGASAVLIKGGHVVGSDASMVVDCFYDGSFTFFRNPRIGTTNTHGTGCTLSAAIAASLANGSSLIDSVSVAIGFVQAAIETAPGLGSGNGPLNHFAGIAATNSRTSD